MQETYIDVGSIKPTASPPQLEALLEKVAEHKGCGTSGGAGKSSCGSSGGPEDMDPEVWEKVKNHPCYSEEAHHHYARMHVAVASEIPQMPVLGIAGPGDAPRQLGYALQKHRIEVRKL